jgi:hypothetical protein
MGKQFQYQEKFSPPITPNPVTFFQGSYPDKIYRKRRRTDSEISIVTPVTVTGLFDAVYPDEVGRTRDFQYSEITTPVTTNTPAATFYQALYPDELVINRSLQYVDVVTPISLGVVVPSTFFESDYPSKLIRRRNKLEATTVTPINLTPTPVRFAEAIYPDYLFKKKDYSYIPFTGELLKTVIVPGAAASRSLIRFYNLRIRLDVKKAVDSGNVDIVATGGTAVLFNKAFKDIDSITLTVLDNSVAITAMYDFVDIPNPTGFTIYIFNAAGVETSGFTVSWKARGII